MEISRQIQCYARSLLFMELESTLPQFKLKDNLDQFRQIKNRSVGKLKPSPFISFIPSISDQLLLPGHLCSKRFWHWNHFMSCMRWVSCPQVHWLCCCDCCNAAVHCGVGLSKKLKMVGTNLSSIKYKEYVINR